MALLMFCQYMQKVTETDARIGNLDKRKMREHRFPIA